jgi:hypothetical protein
MKKTFKAVPKSQGPGGAWTFMKVPFNVEETWGVKGRLAVKGKVNGFTFRNSIFPNGKGVHSMMFSKALQEGAQAKPGQEVAVEMEPDTKKRVIRPPADLKKHLLKNPKAQAFFIHLAPSHQKAYEKARNQGQPDHPGGKDAG